MSNTQKGDVNMGGPNMGTSNGSDTKLIEFFLESHKTNEKYLLVTSSTNGYVSDIIIKTGGACSDLGIFWN